MNLIHLSVQNVLRKKGRTFFLVTGLALGIGAAVALTSVGDAMNREIMRALDEYGANIIVLPASEDLPLSYGGMTVTAVSTGGRKLSMDDVAKLRSIKNAANVSIAAPKLLVAAGIGKRKALLAGVQFPSEFRLKKWWRIAAGEKPAAAGEALAGTEAARLLGLAPGDRVSVSGGTLRIAGVLAPTGAQDDNLLFADIEWVQRRFQRPGEVSLIELAALCSGCPVEEMAEQISAALPGARAVAVKETVELKMQAMHYFHRFSLGVSLLLLIVAGMILFFAMTAAVKERVQEIGLFRAVGFRTGQIALVLLAESFFVSLLAGAAGTAIGMASPRLIAPHLMSAYHLEFGFDPLLATAGIILSVLVGLAASIYPALRASRLDPVEALRSL